MVIACVSPIKFRTISSDLTCITPHSTGFKLPEATSLTATTDVLGIKTLVWALFVIAATSYLQMFVAPTKDAIICQLEGTHFGLQPAFIQCARDPIISFSLFHMIKCRKDFLRIHFKIEVHCVGRRGDQHRALDITKILAPVGVPQSGLFQESKSVCRIVCT